MEKKFFLTYLQETQKSDNTEAAELVTEEYAVDNDVNSKKYAGITHSVGYYNSALYFNVNNKIYQI